MITRYKLLYIIFIIPLCYSSEQLLNITNLDVNSTEPLNTNVTHELTTVGITTVEITTPGIDQVNNSSYETTMSSATIKPPPALGLHCTNSSECKAENSACIDEECSCNKGFITSIEHLRCLKVAKELGDDCSEDIQCIEGLSYLGPTTCLNFKCSCGIGLQLIDGKCQGPPVLKSNCTSDDDCTIKKSTCIEGLCLCHSGYVPNSDNNQCLQVTVRFQKFSSLQAQCTEDIQCSNLGDDAICVIEKDGGQCECKPGTHEVRESCMPYKDLNDQCSFDEECISKDVNSESPTSRICNNGQCKCNIGWTQVDSICKDGASQNRLAGSIILSIILIWISQK